MKITWLGHASFRIEIEGAVLLVDPWLEGNPSFPKGKGDAALSGATHILVTHGHGDHASSTLTIAKERGMNCPNNGRQPKTSKQSALAKAGQLRSAR